jgi:glutamine---fructose-6-phosphate transaminase (isomerizing)
MSRMLEETRQQPQALARTLDEGALALGELRRQLETTPPRLVILVARGTSDNAAQFARYLIEIATHIPVSLAAPSVLTLYASPLDLRDVLVVGISQSGESTDTNAVLADARSRGAITVGITNEPNSTMAEISAFTLLVQAGKEESVAATKTYTCQLLAVYLLAHALGGEVSFDALRRLPEWTEKVLEVEDRVGEIAERYMFMTRAVTVGRGLNYANALGIRPQADGNLLRGDRAVLVGRPDARPDRAGGTRDSRCSPSLPRESRGNRFPAVVDMLEEVKAETLIITDESNSEACAKPARLIRLPNAPGTWEGPQDLYTPIPYIMPAQLFAAQLAAIKGLNPDRPRMLHKITRTM